MNKSFQIFILKVVRFHVTKVRNLANCGFQKCYAVIPRQLQIDFKTDRSLSPGSGAQESHPRT